MQIFKVISQHFGFWFGFCPANRGSVVLLPIESGGDRDRAEMALLGRLIKEITTGRSATWTWSVDLVDDLDS